MARCIDGIESRELTEHDLAAGVLRDQIVSIGKSCTGENRPNHPIRVVEVQTTPHVKRGTYRGGSTGPGSDGILRIATNLLDVPAETIAVLYEHRWTIEIFFRFFKHVLGCRHLLSCHERGIEIQTSCAIIACVLISLSSCGQVCSLTARRRRQNHLPTPRGTCRRMNQPR